MLIISSNTCIHTYIRIYIYIRWYPNKKPELGKQKSTMEIPWQHPSTRFVHLGCLRYWIRGRLNLTDGATGGPVTGSLGGYFLRPKWDEGPSTCFWGLEIEVTQVLGPNLISTSCAPGSYFYRPLACELCKAWLISGWPWDQFYGDGWRDYFMDKKPLKLGYSSGWWFGCHVLFSH